MPTEHSGGGDPARSLNLLWPSPAGARPGPRPALSPARIAAAAVERADAEGLAAVSMRRLAQSLGVGTMSLYTYVPGKAELLDLMIDAVHGELYRDRVPEDAAHWRERLELVARENWGMYRRHPWLLQVGTSRPPLGPGTMAKYEHELRSVEGLGLDEVEMDGVVNLVLGHAQHTARALIESDQARSASGLTDEEWWNAWAPTLQRIMDPRRYPTAVRVGAEVGARFRAAYAPEHGFAFGLERILDGVGDLIGGND